MLELLERQRRLTINQWKIITAAILGDMLDFFDYYLIGFVLAFVVGGWHLTYGQSAMILLSAGVGAIPGAFFWGWMADKIGRRKAFIGTALNFSIATGIMALTPNHGGWIFLTILRFFVGFGVSGLFAVDQALVQEFVPTHKRGWVGGLVTACLPVGLFIGAVLGKWLEPHVGWRGLFAVGLLPASLTLLIRMWVPESPRWLIRKGRLEEARKSIAWALGGVDPTTIQLPTSLAEAPHRPWYEIFKYPRSCIVSCLVSLSQTGGNGLVLWVVTLFVLIIKITPQQASGLVIWLSISGFAGRLFFSYLSDALGRRASGAIVGVVGGILLFAAGYFYNAFVGGVSLFFLLITVQRFFGDGSYAVIGPYSAEIWPAQLRATGMGFGYGIGNFGKVIGPLGLALIVGTSNFVKPQATMEAIFPAMIFLGFWYLQAGIVFWFFGMETKGRSIEEIDEALTAGAARQSTAASRVGIAD